MAMDEPHSEGEASEDYDEESFSNASGDQEITQGDNQEEGDADVASGSGSGSYEEEVEDAASGRNMDMVQSASNADTDHDMTHGGSSAQESFSGAAQPSGPTSARSSGHASTQSLPPASAVGRTGGSTAGSMHTNSSAPAPDSAAGSLHGIETQQQHDGVQRNSSSRSGTAAMMQQQQQAAALSNPSIADSAPAVVDSAPAGRTTTPQPHPAQVLADTGIAPTCLQSHGGGEGQGAAMPSGPRYQQPTLVQPKPPLQGYPNVDGDHITSVFNPASTLNRGIRSLPDALSPDFRQKLYAELLEAGKRERAGLAPRGAPKAPVLPYDASTPLAPGQRQVPKVHPYAGTFAAYEYMPSEYDRANLITKFERLKNKLQQVTPSDFIVKAPPPAPKGAPAFCEFDYDLDPHAGVDMIRTADSTIGRANALSGPFLAGGKVDASVNLRGLADECMLSFCKLLSKDWPTAFLQVFEDSSGAIVVCFDKMVAVAEGDLSSYMQNIVRTGRLVTEFKLVKDAAQWGLLDTDTQSVFYVFWPPWVRHRYLGTTTASKNPGVLAPTAKA